MRKWIFTIAPLTLLVVSTAIAHPIWARRADQTEVLNARITEVDRLGSQIVLEDQARITIPAFGAGRDDRRSSRRDGRRAVHRGR
jgi:hypothetical protein